MRHAGQMVAEILQLLRETVKPGITSLELDLLAEKECKKKGRPNQLSKGTVAFRIQYVPHLMIASCMALRITIP